MVSPPRHVVDNRSQCAASARPHLFGAPETAAIVLRCCRLHAREEPPLRALTLAIALLPLLCALPPAAGGPDTGAGGLPTAAAPTTPANAQPLRIGVLAWRGSERALSSWMPTAEHLRERLPDHAIRLVPLGLEEMETAVASGELDFLITNPGHYVHLENTHGVGRIATLETHTLQTPSQALGSVVIARADRDDLQALSDLAGQRLLAVSPEAFGGFQIIQDELRRVGIQPRRDLQELRYTGFPMDQIVDQVRVEAADAGIIRSCLLESLVAEGLVEPEQFRVVGERAEPGFPCRLSSRLYPDWPFARLAHTDRDLARRVAIALMEMAPPEDSEALGWTVPLSYQPVNELFERLRIGPYADFPENPLAELLYRYRWPLLAGLLVMLIGFGHHVRAEYLIRQRTQALHETMRQREAAEEAARHRQEELAHVARISTMGELAAGLAHELNQPLAAIVNYANGCRRYLEPMDERQVPQKARLLEATRHIAEHGGQAAEVIRNLRAFLRKEPGEFRPVDVNQIIDEALGFMAVALRRAETRVECRLGTGLPPVRGNSVQLVQVLLNLLSNALESQAELPATARFIHLSSERAGDRVRITVADPGEGMADAVRARAFEPFFTTKDRGMGLGLSLSHSLVQEHGGRLSLRPRKSGGTLATIELPLQEETDA